MIAVLFAGTKLAPIFTKDSLWSIIHVGVITSRRSPISLIVIVDMLQSTWQEWNEVWYRGNRMQLPIRQLLRLLVPHAQALIDSCSNVKKSRMWNVDLEILIRVANLPPILPPMNDVLIV